MATSSDRFACELRDLLEEPWPHGLSMMKGPANRGGQALLS